MKTSSLSQCALFACCVAIAGCSQTTELSRSQYTPNIDSISHHGASPLSYAVLYSFGAAPDGNGPDAGLIDVGGTLYGTTIYGGASTCGGVSGPSGTVFSITTGGTEKVLHSFGKGTDGCDPYAGLIDVGGTLYGTTYGGGADGWGTVFSITTGGTEKVLHSFGKGTDGVEPYYADLIDVGGTLYGTTYQGGAYGYSGFSWGTVFSITTGGTEKVLHSFGKGGFGGADGVYPYAGLIDVGGTLYGTTTEGGTYVDGVFFSITTGGTEKVLYTFGKGTDGDYLYASLLEVSLLSGTKLYGTTYRGGANKLGTVFSVTTSGTEKVLHSFGKGTDGSLPVAGLIDVDGTLYGTTTEGGANGLGTVFSITTGGTENVLHSFGKGSDGSYPSADLIDVSGTLYGTTLGGGTHRNGTVFSITP